jgi:hypothetical protein
LDAGIEQKITGITNDTLTELKLASLPESVRMCKQAQVLVGNTSVKVLVMALSPSHRESEKLRRLGGECTRRLLLYLAFNHTLTYLNIGSCLIGDGGALAIANYIRSDTAKIQNLNIANNHIGPAGAGYLAEALKTNTILQFLELQSNNIGDEGARALIECLRTANIFLLDCKIYGNKFTGTTVQADLSNLITRNKSVKSAVVHLDNDILNNKKFTTNLTAFTSILFTQMPEQGVLSAFAANPPSLCAASFLAFHNIAFGASIPACITGFARLQHLRFYNCNIKD